MGHFLSGYADGGDTPAKQLQLVPGAIEEAETVLLEHHNTKKRFERVAQLVEGFETPFGLELLATVHWVLRYESAVTIEQLIQKVHAWNPRKAQFTVRQIQIASDALIQNGWAEPIGAGHA